MSTIVQMPVRVNPPPADTGDTISPGCASLVIATPLNGARMTVSSMLVCSSATCCSATLTCSRSAAMRASIESNSALARSSSACVTTLSFKSDCMRPSVNFASARRTSFSFTARMLAACCALASASAARAVESSSRASTSPCLTAFPSSTFTSTTLPVIFDDTVARRRAVTYPDALRTAACVPAARWVTGAASTSMGRSRVAHTQAPPPAPASNTTIASHRTQRRDGASGARSMRKAARSSLRSDMAVFSNPDESAGAQGADYRPVTGRAR